MSLTVRHLSVARSGVSILHDVSLSLDPGRLLAVIGPNGAGKSTLLHAMADGADGAVTLDSTAVEQLPRRELAQRRAVLPQAATLAFPFSVLDVVLLGRAPHAGRSSRARDLRIADAALGATHTRHLAHRRYPSLSGGERQRVQLARALAQIWADPDGDDAPACLLLDEPTNNLDMAHQHDELATARAYCDASDGVLAILHDPNLASQYADDIAILADGRLQRTGPPADILTASTIAETFGVVADVVPHPQLGHPVVIASGAAGAASFLPDSGAAP